MKYAILGIGLLASTAPVAMANPAAAEFEAKCIEIALNDTLPETFTEDGVRAICACLGEKVAEDPAVAEALTPGLDIPDFDERMASTGPVGQAAVDACTA